MSKKLKLAVPSSSRSLRSGRQLNSMDSSENSSFHKKKTSTKDVETSAKIETRDKTSEQICSEDQLIEKHIEEDVADLKSKFQMYKFTKMKKDSTTIKVDVEKFEQVKTNVTNIEEQIENLKNTSQWMPSNWKIIYENIREMRKHKTAPVDEMGCHKCADPNANAKTSRYQSLLALMLSSQTKDHVTHAAMKRLISYGCTPQIIINTPDDVLARLIHPVGFVNRKVEYIKKTSVILLNKYDGDIPQTIDELCSLPGVGPKMAHICMQIAWGKVSGIGVDTHVHRISNRLSWVKKPTKTPEETRKELEDWLPKEYWDEVNYLLVGFGQEICLPRFPKCSECLNRKICPYAKKNGTGMR